MNTTIAPPPPTESSVDAPKNERVDQQDFSHKANAQYVDISAILTKTTGTLRESFVRKMSTGEYAPATPEQAVELLTSRTANGGYTNLGYAYRFLPKKYKKNPDVFMAAAKGTAGHAAEHMPRDIVIPTEELARAIRLEQVMPWIEKYLPPKISSDPQVRNAIAQAEEKRKEKIGTENLNDRTPPSSIKTSRACRVIHNAAAFNRHEIAEWMTAYDLHH